jgi:opacity protein-like surface antigen
MILSRFVSSIVFVALVLSVPVPTLLGQDTDPEIQELRNRIQVLEEMVLELLDQKNVSTGAEFVPAVLTRAIEPPTMPVVPRVAPQETTPTIRSNYVRELLPEIGKIGAQVGLLAGGSANPWGLNRGAYAGGYIDLPIKRVAGGKISYEILVGLSESKTEFDTTSQVAVVANLAAGASLADSLVGPPNAPFPVTRMTRTRLRLLEVSPFLFKYTITALDRYRFRPYLVAGGGMFVTITNQNPIEGQSALFTGTAPFDAPLLGGQISQSPELVARGIPQGQGNIDFGLSWAIGSEVRVTDTWSMGFEYRMRHIAGGGDLQSFSSKFGFHW